MLQRLDLVTELNALGVELYGAQWPVVLAHNIKRLTASESTSIGSLDEREIELLINGMRRLKATRRD
jgi:hypothetical protein